MKELPLWYEQGNCYGKNVNFMYPVEGDVVMETIAKAICHDCVVVDLCRAYAMKNHESGVWGETTERERDNLRHKIQRAKHERAGQT